MQQPTPNAQPEMLQPPAREDTSAAQPVAVRLSWLTVERAAYIGLALLALALRLANLGAHPLSDAEAGQALVAWRVYHGQPVDQAGYSPLIATLNLGGFLLLGGSEFAVRLGPALLSVALVLLPYGLRRHLGRAGALAASALFAISPTALYLSRTANGDIGAAVGGLALVVGLFGWLDGGRDRESTPLAWLYLAAAGLVLMLTASPSAYSTLALLLGFLALAAAVGGKGYATPARQGLAALRTRLIGWGDFGLVLVVGLIAVATALLFNLGGLAATADLLTSWLLGFAPAMAQPGLYPAIFLLSLYEPLILLTGLFGLSVGLMRRRLVDLFLAWWFFGGIALDLLRAGRTAGEVLVPLVPLTLLGGLALGKLWDSLGDKEVWQREGIIAASGLIISGYAYIELMVYTKSGGPAFWLPLAGLGMFVALVALFWVWYGGMSALRGAALAAVIVLTIFAVATSWRLNYTCPTAPAHAAPVLAYTSGPGKPGRAGVGGCLADPRQPLVHTPAAEGLPDLVTTLERVSSWQVGDPYLLNIVASRRLGPVVEWELRRFENVTWADTLDQLPQSTSSESPEAVLLPADEPLSLAEGYAGQDFAIRASWSPAGLSGQSLVRWIVLRTASTPINVERAVLWVEQEERGE